MGDVPRFDILPHPADVKLVSYGRSIKEMLEYAGRGLMLEMFDLDFFEEKTSEDITVSESNLNDIFFNFLDELLYLYQSKSFVTKKIEINEISGEVMCVNAKLTGEVFDQSKHMSHVKDEIKAITASDLKVECKDGIYVGSVVLDL